MSRRLAALAALAGGMALVAGLVSAPAATAGNRSALAQVRQATVQFHDLATAEANGYQKFLPCFDDPTEGGMGQHWANFPLIEDGVADATHPEVLVYEPHNGKYQLVAVEYVLPPSDQYTSQNPPKLFGEPFHFNPDLQIWALHAWIWRGNPAGVHADFNPNVRMCP